MTKVGIHLETNVFIKKTFSYMHSGSNIFLQRKQFFLIFAHAVTIYESQGRTLEYMLSDLHCTTEKGPSSE